MHKSIIDYPSNDNLLLAALPEDEKRRLAPFLTTVEMKAGQTLIEHDAPIRHIWFPIDAITSTIQLLSDGSSVESGIMGLEGMIGIQLWLRQRTTPQHTAVQIAGTGRRMNADVFLREVVYTSSPLNDLLAGYIHGFLIFTGQTAACNRLHTMDQRLCRWLSMVHNRIPDRRTFTLKQEFLANMLGVQRPTVSVAAAMLQKAGWIRYSRGNLEILDPEGLASGACECYSIIEAQFDKIFHQSWIKLAKKARGAPSDKE